MKEIKEYVTAIEIGGSKLQIALGTTGGKICSLIRGEVAPEEGNKGILNWLNQNLLKLISSINPSEEVILGIGVGFGGPVNSNAGQIIKSMQIGGWDNFPLGQWLEDNFSLPSFVFNDSNSAGYGEYILGSGKNESPFFYINIGSGIGGCLIIEDNLFDGQGYGAGEIGHVRIPDWTVDTSGSDCELEELCSGWSIEARLRKEGYVPGGSVLMDMSGGDLSKLNCKMLGDAAGRKDAFALKELDRIAMSISIALSNVLCLFSPVTIAVGGGVSLIGEPLLERIRYHTKKRDHISYSEHYKIVPCELGESVVINGVILLTHKEIKAGSINFK
jgi:glucokinase